MEFIGGIQRYINTEYSGIGGIQRYINIQWNLWEGYAEVYKYRIQLNIWEGYSGI